MKMKKREQKQQEIDSFEEIKEPYRVNRQTNFPDEKQNYRQRTYSDQDDSRIQQYFYNSLVEDQKRLEINSQIIANQAAQIIETDFNQFKKNALNEMRQEKERFINFLNNQERILKKDVEKRVFSIIDELQDIENSQNKLIDQSIKIKKGLTKEINFEKFSKEEKKEFDFKRKEILVKQASLTAKIDLKQLIESIPQFEKMNEQQKREIYQSIRIGISKELAKIELFKYENEPGHTQESIKKSTIKAELYQNLLKQIVPKSFKNEFLSLKEIQKKKQSAEKSFLKGINDFKNQIDFIEKQKSQLQKFLSFLNKQELQRDQAKLLNSDQKEQSMNFLPYNEFHKKSQKIQEVGQIIDSIKKQMDSYVTQEERNTEKQNQSSQVEVEKNTEQLRNFLLLINNLSYEFEQKLKPLQIKSAERNSKDKSDEQDSKILFDEQQIQSIDQQISFKQKREEFNDLLKKYKVDPKWLRDQKTSELKKITEEKSQKLKQRAIEIENNLLISEKQQIINLINKQIDKNELKQYFVNKLRMQSFVQEVNQYYGEEDQLLTQILIEQLQNEINGKEFNVTNFIMHKLDQIDQEKNKLDKPSISIFDQEYLQNKQFKSAHKEDRKQIEEATDFKSYKLRQLKQLHKIKQDKEKGIVTQDDYFKQMSLTKQKAWYNIYNDYLQNQNQSQEGQQLQQNYDKDFYEQFRNWEFKAFLLQSNFEEKQVRNIRKTLEYLQNKQLNQDDQTEQPNVLAAFQEVLNIIKQQIHPIMSIRNDEVFNLESKSLDQSQNEQFNKIIIHSQIMENENQLKEFEKIFLEDNNLFSIYDKAEGIQDHAFFLKSYESQMKELNDAKKEFMKKYGVNVYNFNPIEINVNQQIDHFFQYQLTKDSYKRIPSQKNPIDEVVYQKDMNLVNQIIEQEYKLQFPKDPSMSKYIENLPKLQIKEELREQIRKHIYDEEIQEQYYNSINNREILEDTQYALISLLFEQVINKDQIGNIEEEQNFWLSQQTQIRDGVDLDNQLVKRIEFYFNEKYQQNLQVVDSLQMTPDETIQHIYDIDKFQNLNKEAYNIGLSDYELQQQILFRLRTKESKIRNSLKQKNNLIDKYNQELLENKNEEQQTLTIEKIRAALKLNNNVNDLKSLLEKYYKQQKSKSLEKKIENQNKINLQSQNEESLQILAINELNSLKSNILIQKDEQIMIVIDQIELYLKNVDQQIEDSNKDKQGINIQKQNLIESLQKQKDESQKSLQILLQKRNEYNRYLLGSDKISQDLKDYISVDQLNSLKYEGKPEKYEIIPTHITEQGQLQLEQTMKSMADHYQNFQINQILQDVPNTTIAYNGDSWTGNDDFSNFINAYSSQQIIEAAKSQKLSPDQQKLALLYDPLNPIREQYLRSKYQMYINSKLRQDLASKIIFAQNFLNSTKQQKLNYMNDANKIIEKFSGQILTQKAYNFLKKESKQLQNKEQFNISDILQSIQNFDPLSQQIENFNNELRLQLAILNENQKLQSSQKIVQDQIQFIIKQLYENNVQPNVQTYSLMLQANIQLNEIEKANQNIKNILLEENKSYSSGISLIDSSLLKKFYEISLSRDNFEGLAHLITYLERKNIDISGWKITKFRSAVDFYLNHSFSLNHIFTFTRFYVHHANCSLSLNQNIQQHLIDIESKSPEILAQVHKEIFGQLQIIVDMNLLFELLVTKLGNKNLFDPISKIDPMQNIIDFFSKKEIQAVQKYSEFSSTFINDDDISKYYANHLQNPESFQRIYEQVMKFNNNQYFISNILKVLRDYSALNDGKLPSSFQNTQKLQKFYIQLKSVISDQDCKQKLSEKAAEFILYILKQNKMTQEIIDLCQNYDKFVEGYQNIEQVQDKSNIRNYYMSEALFNIQIDKQPQNYYKIINNAVFNNNDETSEAFLSSMVKAYMLDGNADYALQFFQKGFEQRKQIYQKQEDMLVNLFDSSFGNLVKSDNNQISLNEFKNQYFDLVQARSKLKKEAKLVQTLQKVLNNCDPQEIESLFMLHAVLREERLILSKLVQMSKQDYYYIYNQFEQCKEDQNEINQFVNNLAQKYSIAIENPELLQKIKDQITLEKFNIDLLKYNIKNEVPYHNSQLENDFVKLLNGIILKFGNQQNNLNNDIIKARDWIDLIEENDIIQKGKEEKKMIKKLQQELFGIKQRKNVLQLHINNKNKEKLMEILNKYQDTKVEILDEVQDMDQILQTLGINQEDVDEFKIYENEKQNIDQVIQIMRLENQDQSMIQDSMNYEILDAFKKSYIDAANDASDQILNFRQQKDFSKSFFTKFSQKYKLKNIQKLVDQAYRSRKGKVKRFDNKFIMERFKEYLYEKGPDNNNQYEDEEMIVKSQIYDQNLEEFYEDLKLVLESRRSEQLPFAIEQFNKIQNKKMPVWLNEGNEINQQKNQNVLDISNQKQQGKNYIKEGIQIKDQNSQIQNNNSQLNQLFRINEQQDYILNNSVLKDPQQINNTIQRYEYLLEDEKSPIISNFINLLDYRDGRDIIEYKEFYQIYKDKQQNTFLQKYLKQSDHLVTLNEELDKIIAVINDIQRQIYNHHQQFVNEIDSVKQFKHAFTQHKEQSLQNLINQNVKDLYNQFINAQNVTIDNQFEQDQDENQNSEGNNNQDIKLLKKYYSRDQKISIMKQTLSLELGGFKSYEIFNQFFAEDFIVFGIKNNIAEAVRLGEYLVSEANQNISQDLQRALKNYKLNYSQEYKDGMQKTGTLNIKNIYKFDYASDPSNENYSKSSLINNDDPYWKEYIDRNFRAQDRYKIPSALAWDHQDHGILGQIVNFKDLKIKKQQFDQLL